MLIQSFLIEMLLFLQPDQSDCCKACETTMWECLDGCPGVEAECTIPCFSEGYYCCNKCKY